MTKNKSYDKYIDVRGAANLLQKMGLSDINEKKIRRAAETDKFGRRKLPFFKSPINGKLVINERILLEMFQIQQDRALKR